MDGICGCSFPEKKSCRCSLISEKKNGSLIPKNDGFPVSPLIEPDPAEVADRARLEIRHPHLLTQLPEQEDRVPMRIGGVTNHFLLGTHGYPMFNVMKIYKKKPNQKRLKAAMTWVLATSYMAQWSYRMQHLTLSATGKLCEKIC